MKELLLSASKFTKVIYFFWFLINFVILFASNSIYDIFFSESDGEIYFIEPDYSHYDSGEFILFVVTPLLIYLFFKSVYRKKKVQI